jgi:hypothetical protein
MTAPLVQMTIRLEAPVNAALARQAASAGQETADYVADLLAGAVIEDLKMTAPAEAKRLQSELELKAKVRMDALDFTKSGFDPDVTLKVFQRIRTDESRRDLYVRAIGGGLPDERGNQTKARINRNLGSMIKTVVGGVPEMTDDRNVVKVQVSNEYILSYTRLARGPGRKGI